MPVRHLFIYIQMQNCFQKKKKKKIKKERGFLGMTVQLKGAFSHSVFFLYKKST